MYRLHNDCSGREFDKEFSTVDEAIRYATTDWRKSDLQFHRMYVLNSDGTTHTVIRSLDEVGK